MNKKRKNSIMQSLPYLILVIVICSVLFVYSGGKSSVHDLKTGDFLNYIKENKVTEMTVTPKSDESIYYITGKIDGYKSNESFTVKIIKEQMDTVTNYAESHNLNLYDTNKDPGSSTVLYILVNVVPILLVCGVGYVMFMKMASGNNKSMDFGRSRAKLSEDGGKVRFSDVAGLKEEKEEVAELIDFLKNPKKFQKLGARIPKGVLLVGPPGTGKTLLAKAVAGEANVPFYYISGSDFVELFVGVGASRVRDMFKQAKQSAPCLIFIDEIDAVGRQRGSGIGGGHDEREQTLNQLLTEMDGFGANEGIIVIAATNRPDVLDPALLRPGRFDRQVTVNYPDAKGREQILSVHAEGKTFNKNVTLTNIAKRTVGFSGADLENLLNEAALLAVRRNKKEITMAEIDEAHDRVLMGPAKKSHKYTDKEKKTVAYHEAGHAVIGLKLDGANDVQKITIIPRGRAGGYNLMLPKEETYLQTKKQLLDSISGLTTGAQNDFEQATKIARAMVTEYGMSDLGPIQFEERQDSVFLGRDYNKAQNFSHEVAKQIDEEVRKIINTQYELTKKIISENKDLLKLIAETLLEYETITKEQIDYLVKNGKMPEEDIKAHESFEKANELSNKSLEELQKMAKKQNIENYENMTKEELIDSLTEKD